MCTIFIMAVTYLTVSLHLAKSIYSMGQIIFAYKMRTPAGGLTFRRRENVRIT